ncbi:MAG: hypothetical protein V1913_01695 [Fibrobacterota bacterium]
MLTLIIILVGLIAVVLTGFSWYRNVELLALRIRKKDLTPSDIYLDYPIRLVWLLYVTVLSVGFIVNNLF